MPGLVLATEDTKMKTMWYLPNLPYRRLFGSGWNCLHLIFNIAVSQVPDLKNILATIGTWRGLRYNEGTRKKGMGVVVVKLIPFNKHLFKHCYLQGSIL